MYYALHALSLVVSCLVIAKGADWLVESAARMAKKFGISELVIGLTVVAFGTSAPEFAVSVGQAVQGNSEIALGNVIGSNVFNVLGVLGVSSIVRPQQVTTSMLAVDVPVMLLASACLLPMVWTGGRISRLEGGLLVAGYGAYLAWLLTR